MDRDSKSGGKPFALHGSHPVHRPGAVRRRRAERGRRSQVTIVLEPESLAVDHPVAVKARAQDTHGFRAAPLSLAELGQLLAPPQRAVDEVRRFAEDHGLAVLEVSPLRHDAVLEGSTEDLERAFQITQYEYEHEHGSYRAHDGPLRIPAALRGLVGGVLGLDTLAHHRPHAAAASEEAAQTLEPAQLAELYQFPEVAEMSGCRIALLEFGGGFYPQDLQTYLSERGLALPQVTVVPITDGTGTTTDNAPLAEETLREIMAAWRRGTPYSELAETYGSALSDFTATLEVTMDLEIAAALAPGAPVDVYFAPGHADGWRRALYAALGEPVKGSVEDPKKRQEAAPPTVISASWGMAEKGWGSMKLRALHDTFDTARRYGVTVCCSSGDYGSRNTSQASSELNVNFPASSPAVLACGGTTLLAKGGEISRETAWKQTVHEVLVASGGGMSGFFSRPSYQSELQTPDPTGTWIAEGNEELSGRWLPDVAASADFDSAIAVRLAGEAFSGGGTSAATPLWAALVTRLAAALGRSLGSIHARLYELGGQPALGDIERGDNDLTSSGDDAEHYRAGAGWDPCTGLGSPRGRALLAALREELE